MSRKIDNLDNITDRKSGAAIAVRVVTRAQRNEIVGTQEDGSIKVRLTAAPTEGQSNKALIAFLAQRLGVPEKAIDIVGGVDKRDKVLSIEGLTATEVEARLKPDPDAVDKD